MTVASDSLPVVLMTGCSSGIGHHCAHALARRGWRVVASARRAEDVQRLRGEGLTAVLLDLDRDEHMAAGLEAALQHSDGRLDALFNNAGFGVPGALEDLPRAALRAQFETNVFGTLELTRRVLPLFRARGAGRVVFNSSVLGFAAFPFRGAYTASKYALEGAADTLRLELRGSGVAVSLIEPGPITSRFRHNARLAFHRFIPAPEHSVHAESYCAQLERLQSPAEAPFTLGPEAVERALWHALTSPHPRARYPVTVPTHLFRWARRLLPDTAVDALIWRASGGGRR